MTATNRTSVDLKSETQQGGPIFNEALHDISRHCILVVIRTERDAITPGVEAEKSEGADELAP